MVSSFSGSVPSTGQNALAGFSDPSPDPGQGPVYDGRLGELAGLVLRSAGLSLLTFGFYRFWGRTRIRAYLWSRLSLAGERFEYDGTPGEKLRRFLVALVVLIPVFALP